MINALSYFNTQLKYSFAQVRKLGDSCLPLDLSPNRLNPSFPVNTC